MRYHTYSEKGEYPVCILVPSIRASEIKEHYIDPFDVEPDDVWVMDLHYPDGKKKASVSEMKQYITEELIPGWEEAKTEIILCSDAEYFKVLTKSPKADANLGYVMDCVFGPWKVVYVPNQRTIFYDPVKVRAKIKLAIDALVDHINGVYTDPGDDIITKAEYPESLDQIKLALDRLIEMDVPLAIDIEAFSLKAHTAGIGSISFAWGKHEGLAFAVDYEPIPEAVKAPYGRQVRNEPVRALLRDFFIRYKQKARYHNIAFDVSVLTYQLFMSSIIDTKNLLFGMEVMLNQWDDTKLISYLATNSCAGNKLSLKEQAQEFAGNYAVENIKDICKIPLGKLLKYNLVDSLSTNYVYEKNYPKMVRDQQENLYETIFKDATVDIIQMQLTGMPINIKRVAEVKAILQADYDKAMADIQATNVIQEYNQRIAEKWVKKRNAELKVKRVTLADCPEVFNPNSSMQLQDLLFTVLGFPVIALTKTKAPATGAETIDALKNHTTDPDILALLDGLSRHSLVSIILTTFIPAMERAVPGPDDWHYLCGNFNLGGTVSGRLSSSDPNLQNIPASSYYAILIKSCFQAPKGWIFCGLDYSSLEDKISGLTTKDPNKLKVYTDGYDGHSLRAYAYFGDQMPGIIDTVASINSIAKLYKAFRQDSKAPTFALTYQGTFITLMKNCGFSEAKAKDVEAKYKDLYKVSIDWISEKLTEASKTGYVTVAFGLRVRTPLLEQVIRGTSKTPYEAEAEGRTAGNAAGQSWCLLNSRSSSQFMKGVRKSQFREDIRICSQIHDAAYFMIRDDIRPLAYTNKHLVEAVQWQEHPDIQHDQVKLGGELSIFYPSWAEELEIPNGVSNTEIETLINDYVVAL